MVDPTTAEINAALARWDGWQENPGVKDGPCKWLSPKPLIQMRDDGWASSSWFRTPPDYCSDLNLIHGLEGKLRDQNGEQDRYVAALLEIVPPKWGTHGIWTARHATAEQCARALYSICLEEHK